VQKSGEAVRRHVQLINGGPAIRHLWADTYDRKLVDIFGVESESPKQSPRRYRPSLPGAASAC